jgi:hypothetical protein
MQGPSSFDITSRVIVISGVPGTGIFIYNGAPALGNPPVLSGVAPGVTADPYGNPIPGADRGAFAAYDNAGDSIALGGAAIVFNLLNAVFGGALVMTAALGGASGVPGLLLTSMSNVNSGTLDSQAAQGWVGRSADGTHGPFIWLGSIQTPSSNVLTIPLIMVGPIRFSAGGVPGGALTGDTNFYRTAAGVLRTDGAFAMTSSALPSSISNAAVEFADGASNLRFIGGGDGINYATGSFRVSVAAAQTSTASFAEIDGMGVTVGGETYIVDCFISGFKNTSAGSATIAFSGPAINYATLSIKVYDATTGAFLTNATLGSLTSFSTPSIGNGDTFAIEITGSVSFSAAGFFQVQMVNGSAATWRANTGSYFSLKPV